jgi:hypothetical protein
VLGNDSHPKPKSLARRLTPSPSMIVAACALLLAGSGVGVAATKLISGSQIRNGTITGAKLHNRTITAGKLASGVVKAYPVVVAPQDEGFYFSDPAAAPAVYGRVLPSGAIAAGTLGLSVSHLHTGMFCVGVGTPVTPSSGLATVTPDYSHDDTHLFVPAIGYVTSQVELASSATDCPNQFEVMTFVVGTLGVSAVPKQPLAATIHPAAGTKHS